MINRDTMLQDDANDGDLVARSLAGNRDAFAQIVTRYQSLICSLAYSATGSLSLSEDLAQETFVAGWKQLRELREPTRLRSWLCKIARNHIYDALRKQGREPSHGAELLETAHDSLSSEPLPTEQAINKEEEVILWRSLGKIPETYREPLILFYREGHSVERVATELELSEDAVRQRLSRGRKLLSEEVTAFVEGALKGSRPGKAFTIGVITALPVFATSVSAATVGATVAQGSTAAKASAATGFITALLVPVLVFFGTWVGYKMSMDGAESERERESVRKGYRILTACIVGFSILLLPLIIFSKPLLKSHPVLFVGAAIGVSVAYVIAIIGLNIWWQRDHRKLMAMRDQFPMKGAQKPTKPTIEYRSKLTLFGLPLVHIRLSGSLKERGKMVKAWFAVGDSACGVIFAFGGLAIAPISMGGMAVGLFSFGGFSVGLLGLGGFCIAWWAVGGMALGVQAFGGCALAWEAAMGGLAIAREFALGGTAHAPEANNAIAARFMRGSVFFRTGSALAPYYAWLNLVWVVPMILWWRTVARRRKQAAH